MLNILMIHQNLPSQFNHLIKYLISRNDVNLVGIKEKRSSTSLYSNNIRIIEYNFNKHDKPAEPFLVNLLSDFIKRGHSVGLISDNIKKQNFYPDIVIAHTGWGETMFLRDRFPNAKLIYLQEFVSGPNAPDINFDPEYHVDKSIIDISNIFRLNDIHACCDADTIITPTSWQYSLIPRDFQHKVKIVHDGIDTDFFRADNDAGFMLSNGKILTKKNKVLTYVARGLEPYRGFHKFIEAIPIIQKLDPDIEIIIVGNDNVYYSPKLDHPTLTYREFYLNKVKDQINSDKIHIYSSLPQYTLLTLLQITTLHAYYTYPLFSSLTIFEAMSCEALVLGSNTQPVTEFITDGVNGFLFDFFNVNEFAEKAVALINKNKFINDKLSDISKKGRETIKSRLDWNTQIKPFWESYIFEK